MSKSLFVAPTAMNSGLTCVCLSLVQALERVGVKVGFYKPFTQSIHHAESIHNAGKDLSVSYIRDHSHLETPDPVPLKRAQQMLVRQQGDLLMEQVVAAYQELASRYDVVVIEGLVPDRNQAYTGRLNVEVVRNLGSEVILVCAPGNRSAHEVDEELEYLAGFFAGPDDPDVMAVILNKVGEPTTSELTLEARPRTDCVPDYRNECQVFRKQRFHLLAEIPWQPDLLAPRVSDVARELGTRVLNEGDMHARRVKKVTVCARTIANMTGTLTAGTLMVTPGDRDDIVVTTALAALNGVPLAGILLTGGLIPEQPVIDLCRRALATGLPVLSADSNTYETARALANLSMSIPADDPRRIEQVMETIAPRIDAEWLREHLRVQRQNRLSPAAFRYQLSERARAANKRIVLPEGNEPRTIQAAVICHQRGLARCLLLGAEEDIRTTAANLGLELPEGLEIIDPATIRRHYVEPLVALRQHKGLTPQLAEAMLEDNVVLGTMMVALDEADGLVSGAIHTTANTVRPALQLIRTHPDARLVSSVFFMLLPEQVVVYGDCAINPDPDAEQLADIAIQSANSAAAFGIEPVVAMISYSTGESGSGQDVEKVRRATRIAQTRRPDLRIDGPLQYDAAAIEAVARNKAPDSKVAGHATVFIFPDLNTGNTTYKAVQRSAGVVSIGPMLQGLRKPVNDLSRGALVDDIVFTIAITAVQAGQAEQKQKG